MSIQILCKGEFNGRRVINYKFEDIFALLFPEAGSLYWILEGVRFNLRSGDSTEIEALSSENRNVFLYDTREVQVADSKVMEKYAKFIEGDWSNILAFEKMDVENLKRIPRLVLDSHDFANSKIKFTCVDSAYWTIEIKDEKLFSLVKARLNSEGFQFEAN